MAIDKDSSGVPEVDLQRPTTKVNLSMIVAIGLFFVIVFSAVIYFARHSAHSNKSAPDSEQANQQHPAPPQPASEPSSR